MNDGTLYYCWSCDAHRRVAATADAPPACCRCGLPLSEDSRLRVRLPVSPAPQAIFDFLSRTATPRELGAAG